MWKQATSDDFDWTKNSGSTPSSGTGPSSGHGGKGKRIKTTKVAQKRSNFTTSSSISTSIVQSFHFLYFLYRIIYLH